MFHKFLAPVPTVATDIPESGSWKPSAHRWSQPEFDALAMAGFSGRPLLVKGEPGTGKSQLARAAAAVLGWRFDYEVISARFEPQDLLWRLDAMRRLADAHRGQAEAVRDERRYVTPGVLWRALDPASAAHFGARDAAQPEAAVDSRPCVVLIDEIDKASDTDLANSLLEVLGNYGFKTPWGAVPAAGAGKPPATLVVLTSNDERELPLAFMRRCVVLELTVPDEAADDGRFVAWLVERGRSQFAALGDAVLADAAGLVRDDRLASPPGQGARPGLAEYLDLLRALHEIAETAPPGAPRRTPADLLKRLSPYVLRKQGQPQVPTGAAAADAVCA